MPPLKERYEATLDYEGKVAESCIHCHQVRDAQRQLLRDAKQPLPDDLLYPFPMPDVVGLKFDPSEMATVKEVAEGSAAAEAGFKKGDKVRSLDGQALISIADVQWVLQTSAAPDKLDAVVDRAGKEVKLTLTLSKDWRLADDISWRPTSWQLRRMATGGLKIDALSAEERKQLKLAEDQLALKIKHVGQYGAHAAAKNAGFQANDIIIEFDGSTKPLTETQLFALGMNKYQPGDKVPVTVLRNGKEVALKLPMQ
jgi:S1-C subfamily serine protease